MAGADKWQDHGPICDLSDKLLYLTSCIEMPTAQHAACFDSCARTSLTLTAGQRKEGGNEDNPWQGSLNNVFHDQIQRVPDQVATGVEHIHGFLKASAPQ